MTRNNNSRRHIFIALILAGFLMVSCDDSTSVQPPESQISTHSVTDLDASVPRGASPNYTFYSLTQNKTIAKADSASTKWDIAFSGSDIIINNAQSGPGQAGAIVLDIPFSQVIIAPSEGYEVDTDSSHAITYSEWGHYTGGTSPAHAILTKDNKTIVVKTADGQHYAKIQIISWYKGNPDVTSQKFIDTATRASSGYYTFKFAIQENGARNFK